MAPLATERTCSRCKLTLPLNAFYRSNEPDRRLRYSRYCKQCQRKYQHISDQQRHLRSLKPAPQRRAATRLSDWMLNGRSYQ